LREHDEVYADDKAYDEIESHERLSVGTRIKWRGLELHDQYVKGVKLSAVDRKIMRYFFFINIKTKIKG
jgi:hypothetical protein